MALYVIGLLVALGCLAGFTRWQRGLFAMIVLVTLQDPLRKLVPGAPGWLVLASAPVMLAAMLQMMMSQPFWWSSFRTNYPEVGRSVMWLVLAAIPPAFISATYGPGSWMFTLLGTASYSVLILAIVMGYHFMQSVDQIRAFSAFFCVLTSVMLSGGFIEYLNLAGDSDLIGTQKLGMTWIRHIPGVIIELIAGFYRSPDVMGWHAATTVMLASILATTAPKPVSRMLWAILAAYAFAALMLCGRRKMVFMIPMFLVICAWLYWMVGKRGSLGSLVGVLLFPLVTLTIVGDWLGDDSTHITYYTDRAIDTIDQVENHSFLGVISTFEQSGFFGEGLGFATPGSQNIPAERPRTWQESAPTRIMVELGVPGVFALVLLIFRLLMASWGVVRIHLESASDAYALYVMGFAALFIVNISSLAVSGQILGDPFVATFLGLSVGFVLGFGKMEVRQPLSWETPELFGEFTEALPTVRTRVSARKASQQRSNR